MSSSRQLLQVVGMAAGSFFGPVGAAVGGIIGGEVGGFIDGPPEGPRLGDLSAPQIEYGGKIGRFYGGPKWFEVSPLYMSDKRESSTVVGGKGGDSGVEQFSYSCDMLLRVCESREGTPCEVIAVTGVEVDGELVWTALADAGAEAIANSAEQEIWSDMAVQLGHEDQAPWSVYEAAVGTDNANAYRGYLTVGFSDFLLAQNGQPRRVRIQAITAGTQGIGDVFVLINAEAAPGAATIEDESAWNNDAGGSIAREIESPGAFGSTAVWNTGTGSGWGISGSCSVPWTQDEDLTLEAMVYCGVDPDNGWTLVGVGGSGQIVRFSIADGASPDEKAFQLQLFDQFVESTRVEPPDYPMALGGFVSVKLVYRGATRSAVATIGGTEILSMTYSGTPPSVTALDSWSAGFGSAGTPAAGTMGVDGVRFTRRRARDAYSVPAAAPTDDAPGPWTPDDVELQDILEYEATRCAPLTAANIDFSAAAGIPVECHVAIGSAAEAMQPLLTRFWFDLFSTDVLTLVRRGGDVEQTIAHKWTGAGQGGRSESFAGLIRGNDVEVAKKKAVTYSDVLKDGEADTRTGDREGVGTAIDTLTLNLNMRPSEAQGLADTATWDARIGAHTATVRLGARHGLLLQPGSVITLTDHQGNTYRCLVLRAVWNRWVWECEVRLDDPTVLSAAGIAVDLDQRALTVVEPPEATLYVLDIPLLRPQDDGPGEYVLATQTGRFRGIDVLKSSDDVSYSIVGEIQQRGTAGSCDSALPAYEGWGWDNSSVLTVTLDDGSGDTLSSATKAAIEASRSVNLCAVGAHGRWELVQFATATLITGTTYELRGILRNLFGTEWANATHEAGDSFALLAANGMARIPGSVADLGQTRYYKAVPRGRSRDNVQAESIVCEEQALLPYAPVDVRNDAGTIRWNRRSRLEGAIGIDPPLGENTERYDAELYDGVTLEDSTSAATAPSWTPGTDPSGLTVRVYQLSELIGRGHVAEKELT
jgi:hypothetical protein